MMALHKARLLAMAICAATVVMLGGCKTTSYGTTSYDKTLDTWIGVHSDNLIVSKGPPDRTYSLSDGRQVFAYYDESTALKPDPNNFFQQSCGTPTYQTTGTIILTEFIAWSKPLSGLRVRDMANDLKRILGRRIRAHRTARGLNQEQLAELIGRSTETISNLERGRTLPSLPTLERLAQSLDVSLAELFDQAEGSRSRQRLDLEARAQALLTTLSDQDIEIAVKQLEALASGKGSPDNVG